MHYESIFKTKNNVPLSMQVCTQQITETKKQVSLNKKQNKTKKNNPIKQNSTTTNKHLIHLMLSKMLTNIAPLALCFYLFIRLNCLYFTFPGSPYFFFFLSSFTQIFFLFSYFTVSTLHRTTNHTTKNNTAPTTCLPHFFT